MNIYIAFVFTFYLCHVQSYLKYQYIYRTLSNIMKQLVGYAKYVSQTGILHSDTTITSFKCTVHLVN